MSNYSYEAVDSGGLKIEGHLEVIDQNEAIRRVKEMGLFPVRIVEARPAKPFFREVRFYYDSVTLFFQDNSISLYGLWIEDCDIIPKFLEPSGYFPIKNTPMDQFLEYLKKEQIPFRERRPPESSLYKVFTKGGVAVMGNMRVGSLVIPCPGTERWRTIMRTDEDLRVPMKKST